MTFTKEQLLQRLAGQVSASRYALNTVQSWEIREDIEMDLRLAEIALASLEAEPVLYCMEGDALDEESVSTRKAVVDGWVDEWNGEGRCPGEPQYRTIPLYTAPPAPVSVPDEVADEDCPSFVKYDITEVDEAWACGFNACRDAMLQGKAEPVSQRLGGSGGAHAKNEPHKLIGAGDIPYGGAGDDLTSRGNGGGK